MAKYILFDTESTGMEDEDRAIQVGAMVIDHHSGDTEVIDEMLFTDREISVGAIEIHHITPEILSQNAKTDYANSSFKKRIDELNNEQNYLIAHNIPFDLKMIEKEGFKCFMKTICTLRCARHLYQEEPHHRLQWLRYSLGLYKEEEEECRKHNVIIKAHDAIGDVLVMKLFLRDLLKRVKGVYPNDKPMEKLAELTQQPVLMKKLTFGKHKGKDFSEVAKTDRQYLTWLKNNTDENNKDLLFTLETYLA